MLSPKARRPLLMTIAVAVVAVFALSVAGSSAATKKTKHKVDLVVKAAIVGTSGDSNTVAGTVSGKPFGDGAVVYRTHPAGSDLAATYTGFSKGGTVRGTTLVTATPQPDGTTTFTGTLQAKGGTGRYRGARGKDLKVTGTLAGNILTFQIKGTIRY